MKQPVNFTFFEQFQQHCYTTYSAIRAPDLSYYSNDLHDNFASMDNPLEIFAFAPQSTAAVTDHAARLHESSQSDSDMANLL